MKTGAVRALEQAGISLELRENIPSIRMTFSPSARPANIGLARGQVLQRFSNAQRPPDAAPGHGATGPFRRDSAAIICAGYSTSAGITAARPAVIPGSAEVDLKKPGRPTGDRRIKLPAPKHIPPLTGCTRGGVTALASRKHGPQAPPRSISLPERRGANGRTTWPAA